MGWGTLGSRFIQGLSKQGGAAMGGAAMRGAITGATVGTLYGGVSGTLSGEGTFRGMGQGFLRGAFMGGVGGAAYGGLSGRQTFDTRGLGIAGRNLQKGYADRPMRFTGMGDRPPGSPPVGLSHKLNKGRPVHGSPATRQMNLSDFGVSIVPPTNYPGAAAANVSAQRTVSMANAEAHLKRMTLERHTTQQTLF